MTQSCSDNTYGALKTRVWPLRYLDKEPLSPLLRFLWGSIIHFVSLMSTTINVVILITQNLAKKSKNRNNVNAEICGK